MLFQFHRGHGDDMLAVPQPGLVGLFDFLFCGNIGNINRFQWIGQHQPGRNFVDHPVRSGDDQDAADTGTGQRFPHFRGVAVFIKDGTLHRLYPVLFAFCRGASQYFRPLDQKAVVDDGVAVILVRYADGPVAFAGSAGTYECYDFHSFLRNVLKIEVYYNLKYAKKSCTFLQETFHSEICSGNRPGFPWKSLPPVISRFRNLAICSQNFSASFSFAEGW